MPKTLIEYMHFHKIKGDHLSFKQSCHTVAEAAEAADAPVSFFVKISVILIHKTTTLSSPL